MNIPDIVKFAKDLEKQIQKKSIRIEDKHYPKVDAYTRMIIDRGDIIIKDTIRMQRFMDDIQDGLKRLQAYGIQLPVSQPKQNENPLK